jgi:hypothetical protein
MTEPGKNSITNLVASVIDDRERGKNNIPNLVASVIEKQRAKRVEQLYCSWRSRPRLPFPLYMRPSLVSSPT